MKFPTVFALAVMTTGISSAAAAQAATFVYRLGKDTVAIEQFTRTAAKLTGEVVNRQGVAVVRTQYEASIGSNGKVSSITYKVMDGEGKPIAGRAREIRYEVTGDSAKRTVTWADSVQVRTVGALNGVPFAAPSYGMLELAAMPMRNGSVTTGTFPVMGMSNAAILPNIALTAARGDTIRQANGLVLVVDRNGLLQSVDGSSTTQKLLARRAAGSVDIGALSRGMKPTGILSARGMSRGSFSTQAPGAVVMVDYGRPLVRDRTVWGGLLIPLDTIWRLGANEATHFATGRDLAFGDVTVPAGLYTLFLFNAKSGPVLVVNRMTGQWGTVYDQSKDVARIPLTMSATPEHVEEFTINIKSIAAARGAVEIAWGAQMATAGFTVK